MSGSYFPQGVGGVTTGITALAGGANTASTPVCSSGVNVVGTVAIAGDSVKLPANIPQYGRVIVANNAAAKLDIFPNAGATINAAAADANLGIAGVSVAEFVQIGTDGLTWLGVGATTAQS